jgi:hypothetical protein
MNPDEQQNVPPAPDNQQGPNTVVQPGQTPQPQEPQQFSNPFANQPFLNQPVSGQQNIEQPSQTPLSPNGIPLQGGGSSMPTLGHPTEELIALEAKAHTTKRLWIALAILTVLLILLGVAYLFLVYVPSLPQNVWKTGFNRSAKAVDAITTNVTKQDTLDALKRSEINGTLTMEAGHTNYEGELHAKYDVSNTIGDIKLTRKTDGQTDKVFTTSLLSASNDTSPLPNIYLQFTGLKAISITDIVPALTTYEGKWIGIDQNYIKSLGVTPEQISNDKDKQITSSDISEVTQQAIDVSSEYFFTTNPKKAVLDQRKFVGKEKVDGKLTYHYVVGINKQHAKDYCASLADRLVQTQLFKKTASDDANKQKGSLTKDCQQYVDDNIKDSDTFDMWIGGRYKLIYKVRFTAKQDKKSFTDLGLRYESGSSLTFFAAHHNESDKTDARYVVETDFKSHNTKGAVHATRPLPSPYTLNIAWEAKPYTSEIKVDKPANVVPIQDVLKAIGLDPEMVTTKLSMNNADTERQADIRSLHGQAEAYFISAHRYPTLANLNDSKWLKTNMPGLDVTALKDPENSSTVIVATPTAKAYAYQPKAKDGGACDNVTRDCVTYTLIATLSDGTNYVKQSLN